MRKKFASWDLDSLRDIEEITPSLGGFPSRFLINSYGEFIERLYKDIDWIINDIQQNPEYYQDSNIEDRITTEFKRCLRMVGYGATHDEKHGGHADLIVRSSNFTWIGEAKIHRDYDYLWKGFQQLNTRYTTGDDNNDCGGMLIYIHNKNAKLVMRKWQKRLLSENVDGLTCSPCPKRDLAFISRHIHERSGRDFWTRHMPVLLYFDPKDNL